VIRTLFVLLCLLPAASNAAQFRVFGDYEIHHNAVRADFIPTAVANAQGITRSATRGLVNIAVLRRTPAGDKRAAEAEITLTVFNLAGQSQAVRMRKVSEPDAIYYIGEFRISGIDTYRFEADVEPEDAGRAYALRWSQQLFAD
jgi:hypothetical protein